VTVYLSAPQVLFIHARLIAETGGEPGIRDLGLLESAVARPKATFDRTDLYPALVDKAAALFESLLLNHAFVDGNKRVTITATALFLAANGYRLVAGNDELVAFVLGAVTERPSLATIAGWLQSHAVAI
jgi:death-on-curing protein